MGQDGTDGTDSPIVDLFVNLKVVCVIRSFSNQQAEVLPCQSLARVFRSRKKCCCTNISSFTARWKPASGNRAALPKDILSPSAKAAPALKPCTRRLISSTCKFARRGTGSNKQKQPNRIFQITKRN